MKSARIALTFLTRLPLPAVPADHDSYAGAIRWFPLAGLVVGGVLATCGWLGLKHDPWCGALLALAAWIGITGALHLDGLGDIADAAGAAHGDRARLSAVLADPHVGAFGVVAIALQMIAKLVLLRLALESAGPWPLIFIPALARIGPIAFALVLPPLHDGMGTLFRSGARWSAVAAWLAALSVPMSALAPASLAGLAALPVFAWWLKTRIGGLSGDGHGAGIELAETAMLSAWVLTA